MMKITRIERKNGKEHIYVETGKKPLLEEIKKLNTERSNLDAYIENLKVDGNLLRNKVATLQADINLLRTELGSQKQLILDKQNTITVQKQILEKQISDKDIKITELSENSKKYQEEITKVKNDFSSLSNDYIKLESTLLLKDKVIENNTTIVSNLENTIKILKETITDLKADKDNLKSDKLKLVNEIEILKINQISFEDINNSFKIESKIEPSIKDGFVTKILEKGNTVESIYPSNHESKVLESIVLSGDNELEEI